ncbi:kinase-like domain-containing protein [Rhizophagus diaphanus]|nr:kinase-like domain-containing protein [Rhizophagus diaphanus] [Rhizophagus sp. MUCL 43196]
MATIRIEIAKAAINRAYALTDPNIQNNLEKHHVFKIQTVLADKFLTKDEKSFAVILLNKGFDHHKIMYNQGTKRICENCHENFSNWTSGNNDIDNLIQQCQIKVLIPNMIVECIPYNNLQNIKYLTKGGCSEIYTAVWIYGRYEEWNSKEKQLKRNTKNVESADKSWIEEGISQLYLSRKTGLIVQCFGLTQNPFNGNYMIIMNPYFIHEENAIHRDLHSGNILFSQINQRFFISDLGFCGPANKPLDSIYGNLSYIAPEVIVKKEYTFASDIYSIGMLMWEISSGQPTFINKHDYDLAIRIINGTRPKIIPYSFRI